MPISQNKDPFSVGELVLSAQDNTPRAVMRTVQSFGLVPEVTRDNVSGGSIPGVQRSEVVSTSWAINIVTKEWSPEITQALYGVATGAYVAGDTNGAVTAIEDIDDSGIVDDIVGIDSVQVVAGKEDDLKYNEIIIKSKAAATVTVYGVTFVDNNRADGLSYIDDSLIIADDVLIPSIGGAIELFDENNSSLGVELVGGSGTIDLPVGSAKFVTYPKNARKFEAKIGSRNNVIEDYIINYCPKKSHDGHIYRIKVPRASLDPASWENELNTHQTFTISGVAVFDTAEQAEFVIEQLDALKTR